MVTDILSEGEFAVGHQCRRITLGRKDHDLVELVCKHLGLCLELGRILFCPPGRHVAVLVEEASLVVESVRHLMSDNDSDRSVVDRVVSIRIEERRLEDSCREADLVGGRVVICVDGLRRHAPLSLVGRLAELGEIVGHVPLARSPEILEIALFRIDVEGGIVLPLVRVADLHGEVVQLLVSLGLG